MLLEEWILDVQNIFKKKSWRKTKISMGVEEENIWYNKIFIYA